MKVRAARYSLNVVRAYLIAALAASSFWMVARGNGVACAYDFGRQRVWGCASWRHVPKPDLLPMNVHATAQ